MLESLSIRDIVLIERLTLDFDAGLNVLTGETGAGKSILLDALGFGSLIAGLYTRRLTRTAEEGGVERFIQRAFRPQQPPEGYLDYVGAPLALRAKTLEANAADLAKTNPAVREISERYAELNVPVEIMHGDADWLLDIEQHGVELAKRLPNASLTALPSVGHMAHHARIPVLEEIVDRLSATA